MGTAQVGRCPVVGAARVLGVARPDRASEGPADRRPPDRCRPRAVQGDWEAALAGGVGLSTGALSSWAAHIEGHSLAPGDGRWQQLTPSAPQLVRCIEVAAGQQLCWQVGMRLQTDVPRSSGQLSTMR